ncbi:MAG: DUF6491 family protein [Pseudomonadota bacterium]
MFRKTILIGALSALGCATTGAEPVNDEAAAKLAEYNRTGEKTNCLNTTYIDQITAVDEKTLLIRARVSDYYVVDLSGRCNGATRISNRFEYTTSTGQLCRNEIIRIVDNTSGFTVGSCGMGEFEKLAKKPPAE